jgi:hypothetical protein
MATTELHAVPSRSTNLNAKTWVIFALSVTMELLMTMEEVDVDCLGKK